MRPLSPPLALLSLLLVVGCGDPIVPNAEDTSRPLVRVSVLGRRNDVLVTSDAVDRYKFRARATDDLALLLDARDDESGIASLAYTGFIDTHCSVEPDKRVTIREPLGDVREVARENLKDLETFAVSANMPNLRAKCPPGSTFYLVSGEVAVTGKNSVGLESRTPTVELTSAGPDQLKVATFNLYRPGNHPDSVYPRWGDYLKGKVDLLLLTEVEDRRRAEIVAHHAGLAHVVLLRESDSDVAIAAAEPIRNVERHTVVPPNSSLGSAHSNVLIAEVDFRRYPHKVAAMHWGIRDSQNESFEPWRSAPGRVAAAERLLSSLESWNGPIVVGGDLNAYSGRGPQGDHPGSTQEVDLIFSRLGDPFRLPGFDPNAQCGFGIDYLFHSADYVPSAYLYDCTQNEPSDHPMVIATFEVP